MRNSGTVKVGLYGDSFALGWYIGYVDPSANSTIHVLSVISERQFNKFMSNPDYFIRVAGRLFMRKKVV